MRISRPEKKGRIIRIRTGCEDGEERKNYED